MIKKINYVLDYKQKIKLVILLIVILGGAFVELLGVTSILPIITVATNPALIDEKWYLLWIKENLNISEVNDMVILLSVLLIIIYVVKNIYISLMYNFQYHFIFSNQKKLAVRLMNCYMNQRYLFFVSKNVAELQRNVTSDVNGFYTVVLNFLQFLAETSVCIVIGIFLLMKDFVTTVSAAIILLSFVFFFAKFFKKVLGEKGKQNREVNVQVTKWILQSFSGIKEIKIINKEKFFVDNYDKNYTKLSVLQRQQSILTFLPRPIMETVCIAGLLIAVIIKFRVGTEDVTSFIPTLSVFAFAAFRMLPSFNRITGYLGTMMFNKPSIDAIYNDMLEVQELLDAKKNNGFNQNIVFNETIEFKNISFHYPNNEKYILNNCNLKIFKNESIAFIGASGAGKTTVADLLLGLLEPQKGKIEVDGVDIQNGMESWRSNIGYIPQSIYLIDDSIRANIAFGISDEEIDEGIMEQVLKEAQLSEFVHSLPDGLNTQIGDRGVKLSGGQRQRIGIARALYRQPRVLILDEATSALDNDTEKEVMNAIENLQGTRTMIIIAHRLSTIQKCNTIYEVKDGQILQTHL